MHNNCWVMMGLIASLTACKKELHRSEIDGAYTNPKLVIESYQAFGESKLSVFGDKDFADGDLSGFAGNGLGYFAGIDDTVIEKPQFPAYPVTQIPKKQYSQRSYASLVEKYSAKHKLPEALIHAVIRRESNYDPNAISHAGAKGLMQLMDDLTKRFNINPFDPEQNIRVGTYYLSQLIERYQGNVTIALAAYNAGPGRVARYGGVPPFRETQQYIKSILHELGEGS